MSKVDKGKGKEPPHTMKRLIASCSNPGCTKYNQAQEKAPRKCAQCKSAQYCDKECQKAHWPVHKEFCKIWAETSANNDEIAVAQVKLKMARLIWLVRGMPEYSSYMWKEYLYWNREKSKRGCMEFFFNTFQELFDAVDTLESLPIYDHSFFCGMPGSPSFGGFDPKLGPIPQKIEFRKVVTGEQEKAFRDTVDDKLNFTENTMRPNLQKALDLADEMRSLFVISVSVQLQGTYATHMHDFIYRNLSWYPEL